MFTRIGRSAAVDGKVAVVVAVVAVVMMMGAAAPVAAAADSAESIYSRALGRERELKDDISGATLAQLRWVVRNYESVVRRFPKSGYCDNALWQGGNLALVRGDWNRAFLDEHELFPMGKYKDQVDAAAAAFNLLTLQRRQTGAVVPIRGLI